MKNKYLFPFAIMILSLLHSCGESENQNVDDFDRTSMLQNIGNNIILKAYQEFKVSSDALYQSAEAFSSHTSAENLADLQTKWLAAKLDWKSAEMFNLGPVEDMAIETSIDNWPTNTNAIESAIENATAIDNSYITSLGSSTKGLPAIEYLIFDKENGDEFILEAFSANEKRVQFLVALSENLKNIASEIFAAWDASGDNYLAEFSSSSGKDVGSSTNMLANQLIILVEDVKNNKLGIPLGKKSMGTLLPKNAEAWRSGKSLEFIREDIDAVEMVFSGDSGPGFDDYLDAVNAQHSGTPLSQVIKTQISALQSALDEIDGSLYDALESENAKVEAAYTESQKLLIYLKTDMMSSLGLLVTYSDNDGD